MLYFLLALIVLLIPFSLRIKANTENKSIVLQAEFMCLFKTKILNKRITVNKIIKKIFSKKKSKKKNPQTFNIVKEHITVEKLELNSVLGLGDASTTAIVSGQAFGIIAPFVASFAGKSNFNVNIAPDYNEKKFLLSAECIISTNLANTIIAFAEIIGGMKNGKASY